MIKFQKPEKLNGAELIDELRKVGIEINDSPEIDGNGDLWLHIKDSDASKAKPIMDKHVGTTESPELSIEQKLKLVGVELSDLRKVLGLESGTL